MRLEHPDYIKLVIEAYYKKRAHNELSPLLAQSTPANIRRECLNVYKERYDRKDEKMLRAFFGPAEPGKQFLQIIRDFSTDRFRPLDNFLKGSTEKTDDRNLELLAWLIDFQHRPFVFKMEVKLNEDELSIIDTSEKNGGNSTLKTILEEEEGRNTKVENPKILKIEESETLLTNKCEPEILLHAVPTKKVKENRHKRTIIIFLIIATCCSGGYFIWQKEQNKQTAFGRQNTGCMYWTGNDYTATPCSEELKGHLKLPMDSVKLKGFKRILLEDTITEKSIGKVYYIKIDGRIEYYTAGGNHPIDVTRILKPLSPYMFFKYLSKKENDNKTSVAERKVKLINNH